MKSSQRKLLRSTGKSSKKSSTTSPQKKNVPPIKPFLKRGTTALAAVQNWLKAVLESRIDEVEKKIFHTLSSRFRIQASAVPAAGIIGSTNEAPKQLSNPINHPQHYTFGKIEVIDFIDDQFMDFYTASIVKYLCRAPHKGQQISDLKKAQWYLTRLIANLQK